MTRAIIFTRAAARNFDRLPEPDRIRIARRIDMLKDNPRPHGCVKLEGMDDLYRIRCGMYRILYIARDDLLVITVIRIDNRGMRIGELGSGKE